MPKHAAVRGAKPLHTPHHRNTAINRAPSPRWISNFREQIKVKELIKRLQTFALDDPDAPTAPRLTRTQAMVGLAMLKKCLPDMQSLEISGNQDQPITVQILRFADPANEIVQMSDGNGAAPMASAPSEPLLIDLEPSAFEAKIEANPRLIEDEPAPSVGRSVGRRSTRTPKV